MADRSTEAQRKYGSFHSGEDLAAALSRNSDGKGKNDVPEVSAFQQFRDICESLVVALFLAFLFKTFEAEAFVIPTGSMAPTLKGRHKDVVCDECRFQFQTSASEEVDAATNRRNGRHVVAGTCPQCGYTQYFGDDVPRLKNDKKAPSYTGDRILVSKMAFDQREIKRFDVSVFRSPSEPRINFIKRIVGFPNERLRVQYGDLFVQKVDPSDDSDDSGIYQSYTDAHDVWSPDVDLAQTSGRDVDPSEFSSEAYGAIPFEIQRKDYQHLRQIMQVVYDADYPAHVLEALGWPERWSDDWENLGIGVQGWTKYSSRKSVSFAFSGEEKEIERSISNSSTIQLGVEADVSSLTPEDDSCAWLRYRHIVPTSKDWLYLADGKLPPDVVSSGFVANNPRLIDDFSGYNAGVSRYAEQNPITGDYQWSASTDDEFHQLTRHTTGENKTPYCAKNPDGFGCNWVGDLGVSCELSFQKITATGDKAVFDLVKGGVAFRCVVVPSEGTITLEIPSVPEFQPVTTSFRFRMGKKYRFAFYNVDEEMRVVIDDHELSFPELGGRYDSLTVNADGSASLALPRNRDPNARDLAPVAIGVRNVAVNVSRLRVLRDVYYIAAGRGLEPWDSARFTDFGTLRCDRLGVQRANLGNEDDAARFMSTPSLWEGYGNTKSALLRQREGQYVAFGDNSGFSLDSRLWATNVVPHYVDRKYLIGKAFYVYWPHGISIPGVGPYWPNVDKMRHID